MAKTHLYQKQPHQVFFFLVVDIIKTLAAGISFSLSQALEAQWGGKLTAHVLENVFLFYFFYEVEDEAAGHISLNN